MAGLLFPSIPILVNGGMMLLSSVWDWWEGWEYMWPLEVLSVAAAFTLAALMMRKIWLLLPAIFLGLNGLLFQFCAVTGMWDVWAIIWTIEPLSVGLGLLLIGARKGHHRLMLAGVSLCCIGGVSILGMASLLATTWAWAAWWVFRFTGPAALVLAGALLVLWGLSRRAAPFKVG